MMLELELLMLVRLSLHYSVQMSMAPSSLFLSHLPMALLILAGTLLLDCLAPSLEQCVEMQFLGPHRGNRRHHLLRFP
jgi:hypothetical protein